jgi:hypothetical protein
MFFRFPPDARWNPERSVVEFGIGIGDYEGVVRIPRRVFQTRLDQAPTPERCLEAYHLQRTRFELIAESKLRRRQLTDDLNVEIIGRDLGELGHLRRGSLVRRSRLSPTGRIGIRLMPRPAPRRPENPPRKRMDRNASSARSNAVFLPQRATVMIPRTIPRIRR